MTEIKPSLLLQFVLMRAESLSKNMVQEPLEEHVFLAMLEICQVSAKTLLSNSGDTASVQRELDELTETVRKIIGTNSLEQVLPDMTDSFQEQLEYRYPIMAQTMAEGLVARAREQARKDGRQTLSAPYLLDFILANKTPLIREFIDHKRERPEPAGQEKRNRKDFERSVMMIWSLRARLLNNVKGQNNAVYAFVNGISSALIFHPEEEGKKSPRGIFVFAGPPGVGKTFLAEQAAKGLGLPSLRLDMSEYVTDDSAMELFGRESVYVNSKEGTLTGYVKDHPASVLIFDEIEKAAPAVINEFLQILDAGRLTDHHTGKTVSFADTFLIFTTNAGRNLYEADTPLSGQVEKEVLMEALRTEKDPDTERILFPPAICSRLGTGYAVLFNHLGPQGLVDIAKGQLDASATLYRKKYGIQVKIDSLIPVILLLACGGDTDARRLRAESERFFKEEIFKIGDYIGRYDFEKKLAGISLIRFEVPEFTGISTLDEMMDADKGSILVQGSYEVRRVCEKILSKTYVLYETESCEIAQEYASKYDFLFALAELPRQDEVPVGTINGFEGTPITAAYLRKTVNFLDFMADEHPEVTVYLLHREGGRLPDEFLCSELERRGVRGLITVNPDGRNPGLEKLKNMERELRLQVAAKAFARERKKLIYETAPLFNDEGTQITIRVRNFREVRRISGEDAAFIRDDMQAGDVRFDDVLGAGEAKRELKSCIECLKAPARAVREQRSIPRGILLYGPPGTGKTYLAQAMAHEAGLPFLPVNGSDFVNYYVGSGAKNVRDLFAIARRYAPSIVFIDEIDAIGKARTGEAIRTESENALNALLYEMDGFSRDQRRPVFVMAATNFPIAPTREEPVAMDPALLRRFDRKIRMDLPGLEERREYISRLTEENDAQVSRTALENIARRSVGMNYSALRSAVELAVRLSEDAGEILDDGWLNEAFEQEWFGGKKEWSGEYLERAAVHEAGHALINHLTGHDPEYISIVARGDTGGYVQEDAMEDRPLLTREEILHMIDGALAGRAAEIVCYGPEKGLSTGASDDLSFATSLACDLICVYGMDELCGLAVYPHTPGILSDRERERVERILSEEMESTQEMLNAHLPQLKRLIGCLLERNRLSADEIKKILKQ